jgi:hypothetical protein
MTYDMPSFFSRLLPCRIWPLPFSIADLHAARTHHPSPTAITQAHEIIYIYHIYTCTWHMTPGVNIIGRLPFVVCSACTAYRAFS